MTISPANRANPSVTLQLTRDESAIRRAETDLDRRNPTLGHAALISRTMTMPHQASLPPRSALPAMHDSHSSLNAYVGSPPMHERAALFDGFERSDRFTADTGAPPRSTEHAGQPPAPAGQSWRAMLGAALGQASEIATHAASQVASGTRRAAGSVAHAAAVTKNEFVGQVSALQLLIPGQRLTGAALGHLVHQTISVGVPTFAREMMAEALVLAMRHMPAHHALGLQFGVSVVSVGAQAVRRMREARNPDAAARGFHAMNEQQWSQLSPADQAQLRKVQQLHSHMVTNLQVMASLTHLSLGAYAVATQDSGNEASTKLFVKDFKTIVYSAMRDSLQASFSMVNTNKPTNGVSGTHMTAAATFYALANAGGNYAFSYLPGLVPHAKEADQVLRGESDAMSPTQAWLTKAGVAGVKAAINTVVEASDWMSVSQQEANQAGAVQKWDPTLKVLDPEKRDYGRLLDQTPGRIAVINAGNAIFSALGVATKKQPEWAQNAVANLTEAAYEGLKYKTVGGTWQADSAVRSQPVEPRNTGRAITPDIEQNPTTAPSHR